MLVSLRPSPLVSLTYVKFSTCFTLVAHLLTNIWGFVKFSHLVPQSETFVTISVVVVVSGLMKLLPSLWDKPCVDPTVYTV